MQYIEELIKYFTDMGVSRGLAIAYLIISALLIIMAIVAIVMRIIVMVNYLSTNKVSTSTHKTSNEVAREALDKAGLNHIQVKKAGFLRAWFFGNCYSITKKTIFLRKTVYDKDSLTAVGLALQKVGIAKMCEGNGKMAKTRNIMQIVGIFGPFLFIPIMLVGFLADLLILQEVGMFSIIALVVSLAILGSGFVVTLLNIPVEKKANNMAMQMIEDGKILNEEEQKQVKKVLNTYIVAYVCEFIVTVLRIAQLVLEIVMQSQINSNKS